MARLPTSETDLWARLRDMPADPALKTYGLLANGVEVSAGLRDVLRDARLRADPHALIRLREVHGVWTACARDVNVPLSRFMANPVGYPLEILSLD